MSCFSKEAYVLIRTKDIYKISILNSEDIKIISKIKYWSKMKINYKIEWTKYIDIKLIKMLDEIPHFIWIELDKLHFYNEDIESKFWKAVLKCNEAIIHFNKNEFIRILKVSHLNGQSAESSFSYKYWTKKEEFKITFEEIWQHIASYINKNITNS